METSNIKIRFLISFESSEDLPTLAHMATGASSGLPWCAGTGFYQLMRETVTFFSAPCSAIVGVFVSLKVKNATDNFFLSERPLLNIYQYATVATTLDSCAGCDTSYL